LSMFKDNKNLAIIGLIAVVNALGYGIIIPVLYSYSQKFGLSDFQNGLLFALFSLCQFVATPIIGRMSDKYGRKPLLVSSIAGTALSFFIMAFAPSALFLFIARALDGITAGNIPVASAVISDTTEPKDRAKGFGIIGASFGFGFIFGPVISGLTVGFGTNVPFIIAGVISLIAVVITHIFLPETNKHIGDVKKGKLFDFSKMFHALTDKNVGKMFLITLIYNAAFAFFIAYFQPFSHKVLHLNDQSIAFLFTMFGVVGVFTQIFLIPRITKWFGIKKVFSNAILFASLAFLGIFLTDSLIPFVIVSIVLGLANSSVQPLIQTILSRETDEKSQGSMLGLNASYMSIGQIVGPVLGGVFASIAVEYPFLVASILAFVCFLLSLRIAISPVHKESAF
jgi:MFS family permease